jgi:O-antigen ligase
MKGGLFLRPIEQIGIAIGLSVLLAGLFITMESPMGWVALFAMIAMMLVIRNPTLSLFAFIISNVILALRPREIGQEGAPTVLDLLFGICLAAIIGYWMIRIRILESQALSTDRSHLLIILFGAWSVLVSATGFLSGNNQFFPALREMLNLSPLAILPLLYERYVQPDSATERRIFVSVLLSGCTIVLWNYLKMRSNLIGAIYFYEVGRGTFDITISGFLVLIATSSLMSLRKTWKSSITIVLFLLTLGGVIISFSRSLYVATFIGVLLTVWLGNRNERRIGTVRLLLTGAIGVLAMIPIYLKSRLIRLLLQSYFLRIISTQHMGTDVSLRLRYGEWRSEWHQILRSPILGYGFGSKFRVYDFVMHHHFWSPFSHSSYLYMVFKTGFVGAFLFFAAYFGFMYKGFQLTRSSNLSGIARIAVRACLAYLLLILVFAYAAPVFDSKTDLIWVGLIWGYFLALEKQTNAQSSEQILSAERV